ncbi:hypothetical protein JCM19376_14490 [Fusibacter bizertensis]
MITEFLLNLLLQANSFLLDLLPDSPINFNVPDNEIVQFIGNIIYNVGYFLPMPTLLLIFTLWLATKNFELIWRLIQRVWDALPFT